MNKGIITYCIGYLFLIVTKKVINNLYCWSWYNFALGLIIMVAGGMLYGYDEAKREMK